MCVGALSRTKSSRLSNQYLTKCLDALRDKGELIGFCGQEIKG